MSSRDASDYSIENSMQWTAMMNLINEPTVIYLDTHKLKVEIIHNINDVCA